MFNVFQIEVWFHLYLLNSVHSARILGVFPMEGRSHFNFHEAIAKSLLSAGHHVTLIAPFQPQNYHENLTIISSETIQNTQLEPLSTVADPNLSWFSTALLFLDFMEYYCNQILSINDAAVR